jgi:hypothetical protein
MLEQLIREYYKERLNAEFESTEYGFIAYSIQGPSIIIHDFYTRRGTKFHDTLRLINTIKSIGQAHGCIRLIGSNDTKLVTYYDIKQLHKFYRMTHLGNDGSMEIWGRDI